MKKISLKREIAGILETAIPCEKILNREWNKEQTVHRATTGNFTCAFATDELNSREEVVEWLEKKAERMFRKPSTRIDRGLNFQKALLFIGEHREIIPLLQFLRDKCGCEKHKVSDTMKKWVEQHLKKHGAIPPYIKPYYYSGFSKLYYCFENGRTPESLYEVVDMIPKAWLPS